MTGQGTTIEGTYTITSDGERVGDEFRYSGHRISDAHPVEVRIMRPDAPVPARKHFSEVASLLGRVDHENCLSALGAGQLVDRTLYIVAEGVEAGPLQAMHGQPVPDRELAEIALQLFRGLEHLHAQGVVIGALSPRGVVLGREGNNARLRILDFTNAHVRGRGTGHVHGLDTHWIAPEILDGEAPTEASDVYSAGRILEALCSNRTSPELRQVIGGLVELDASYRLLATEACFRLVEVVEEASRPFDFAWLPPPELTAFSSGVYDIPRTEPQDSPAAVSLNEGRIEAAPEPAPLPVFDEPQPSRSRIGIGIGLLAAGIAAAGVIYAVSSRPAEDVVADEPVAAAAVASRGTEKPEAAPAREAGEPSDETPEKSDKPEGNPIVWLAAVNRTDLGTVLPYDERQTLLDELSARGRIHERVNHRWNAMLDLWQAKEAERPCATFAAALATLESPPDGELEKDLLDRVVVPSVAPKSRAGVGPDESCEGLSEAFATFKDSAAEPTATPRKSSKSQRKRSRPAAPAAAPDPAPKAKPKKKPVAKPSSVATKLDDDLREF